MKVKKFKTTKVVPILIPDGVYQFNPKLSDKILGSILVDGHEIAFRLRKDVSVTNHKTKVFLSFTTKGFPYISSIFLKDSSPRFESNYFGENVLGTFDYVYEKTNKRVYYHIILNLDSGYVEIKQSITRLYYEVY